MQRSTALRVLWVVGPLLALGLSLSAAPALAQETKCARPRAPEVPDGEKASDVQMIGANQRMKLYQTAVQTFMECIATARSEIGTVARDMKLRRLDKQRDEVTAELKETAEKYNSQVRAYRARQDLADTPEGEAPDEADPEDKDVGSGAP